MVKFLTELDVICINDGAWRLNAPLVYESDIVSRIEVPKGFETDFASVPRVPVVYTAWGDRAHREAVLHDYLYRTDSIPIVTYSQANSIFKEAMVSTGKPFRIYYWMYLGVVLGGWTSYHKRKVKDKL
jgi:hypothetical protein